MEHKAVSSQFTRGTDILQVFEGEYALVSIPSGSALRLPEGGDLTVVIHDPVEITLIIEVEGWQQIAGRHWLRVPPHVATPLA